MVSFNPGFSPYNYNSYQNGISNPAMYPTNQGYYPEQGSPMYPGSSFQPQQDSFSYTGNPVTQGTFDPQQFQADIKKLSTMMSSLGNQFSLDQTNTGTGTTSPTTTTGTTHGTNASRHAKRLAAKGANGTTATGSTHGTNASRHAKRLAAKGANGTGTTTGTTHGTNASRHAKRLAAKGTAAGG